MAINSKILFVYGSDDFLVDRRARILYDEYCQNGEIFTCEPKTDVHTFINSIYEAVNTVSLFSNNNLWIRGIKFFGALDSQSEVIKNEIHRLLNFINSVGDVVVVISANPIDRRTKLFKDFSQHAECFDVTVTGESVPDEFMHSICSENHVKISHDAIRALQDLIGKDSRLMKLELDKLATYIYGDHDTISVADVDELVDASHGGEFFQQIEKFYDGNISDALDSMDRYFYYTNESRPLIAGLQNRTRLMIQLRALVDSNKIQLGRSITKTQLGNITKLLNFDDSKKSTCNVFSQNPWYLSKIMESVGNYSIDRLLNLQTALMDAIGKTSFKYDGQVAAMKELVLKFHSQ